MSGRFKEVLLELNKNNQQGQHCKVDAHSQSQVGVNLSGSFICGSKANMQRRIDEADIWPNNTDRKTKQNRRKKKEATPKPYRQREARARSNRTEAPFTFPSPWQHKSDSESSKLRQGQRGEWHEGGNAERGARRRRLKLPSQGERKLNISSVSLMEF